MRRYMCWLTVMVGCAGLCSPLDGAAAERKDATAPTAGSGSSETVLAADGGWGYNAPYAVLAGGKLFWTYLDTRGMIWAASYCLASGKVHRTGVWQTYRDLHQASPLLIRPDGRIQVFVHEGRGPYTDPRIQWRVSVRPGDITEFGELQSSGAAPIPQGRQFYPMNHTASGTVYLVVNARGPTSGGGRRVGIWKSVDGGDTFDSYHLLFGLADDLSNHRCYTAAYIEGDDIHFVSVRAGWNEAVGDYTIGRVEGVYYIRYRVTEEAFYRADGTRSFRLSEAPVHGVEYFDVIWDWVRDGGRAQRANWASLVAKNGRPYIAYVVQDAVPDGEVSLHRGYWATPDGDGQWRSHRVAAPLARGIFSSLPPRCNYAIAIDPEDPETVFVSRSVSDDGLVSEVHRMSTRDGGETWESLATLSGRERISTLVVPRRLEGTPRAFDVLWLSGPMRGWGGSSPRIVGAGGEDALR